MTLSERLAAAAAERRGEAAPLATPSSAPRTDDDWVVVTSERGLPLPCTNCGGDGFLDRIDLTTRVQHEHCRTCGLHWSRPV